MTHLSKFTRLFSENTFIKRNLVLACFSILLGSMHAQITIGTSVEPNTGALLDLKQDTNLGANSKKGLALPRVELKGKNTMEMGSLTIPNDQYSDHIGLLLYNTATLEGDLLAPTREDMLCPGVHIWTGTTWMPLPPYPGSGNMCDGSAEGSIGISDNKIKYVFASGRDKRVAPAAQQLQLKWSPASATVSVVESSISSFPQLVFSPTLPSTVTGNGSVNYSLAPSAMTLDEIKTNPFTSKKQKLTFSVIDKEGDKHTVDVELIQTNYAIQVDGNLENHKLTLNRKETYTLPVLANVNWEAEVVLDPSFKIIENVTGTSGGSLQENGVGTPITSLTFDPTVMTGTLRTEATIKFTDKSTVNGAKDITVTVLSCLGTEDFSQLRKGNITDTNNPNFDWGTDVVLHDEKPGVYGAFVSAYFGKTAGRWMTTNLTAWGYDGITHLAGRQLVQHDGNSDTHVTTNKAAWTYPGYRKGANPETITAAEVGQGPTDAYANNPFLGLLFTWDAATAGKGGLTGLENLYAPAGQTSGDTYKENSRPEWTGTGITPDVGYQTRVQGICPKGWHLPSDYEWTELERELTMNTSKYADMEDISKTPETDTDPSDDNTVGRESVVRIPLPGDQQPSMRGQHGPAMISPCPPYDVLDGRGGTMGHSHAVKEGGFEAGLSGYAVSDRVGGYGSLNYIWSSSMNIKASPTFKSVGAYMRSIDSDSRPAWDDFRNKVGSGSYPTWHMIAVRCKQDRSYK